MDEMQSDELVEVLKGIGDLLHRHLGEIATKLSRIENELSSIAYKLK